MSQIPIIDLSKLGKDDKTSFEIDMALQEFGMFIGTNAMSKANNDEFVNSAYNLFSMNKEAKDSIKVTEGGFMRGYIPFGQESGLNTFFEPKEGFSYGHSFTEDDLPFQNSLEGENVWPDEEHFSARNTLKLMFSMSTRIATDIVRCVADSYKHHTERELGLTLEGGDRISIMRLFHYFAKDNKEIVGDRDESSIIGSSPHTDWGLLTVITQQEHVGGLQAFHRGEWLDVPSDIPGSVVVNGGDFLSMVSQGRYTSPLHRVQAPQSQNRISFVYFYYPSFDTPLDMSESLRNSKINGEEGKGEFNTLVSEDALAGLQPGGRKQVFGDFIVNKWRGVFKGGKSL